MPSRQVNRLLAVGCLPHNFQVASALIADVKAARSSASSSTTKTFVVMGSIDRDFGKDAEPAIGEWLGD